MFPTQNTSLTFARRFEVPEWNDALRQKALDFWTRRGMRFETTQACRLAGQRGSWWGNCTSFNMSKLRATLVVTVSEANEVRAVLQVDTTLQEITVADRGWWELEMESFESFLFHNDEQDEKWQEFHPSHKKASLTWLWQRIVLGRPPQGGS